MIPVSHSEGLFLALKKSSKELNLVRNAMNKWKEFISHWTVFFHR